MGRAGHRLELQQAREVSDFLRCTQCGAATDVSASSLYDTLGKTKRGTWRKRNGWRRSLAALVTDWRCHSCLDHEEGQSHDFDDEPN